MPKFEMSGASDALGWLRVKTRPNDTLARFPRAVCAVVASIDYTQDVIVRLCMNPTVYATAENAAPSKAPKFRFCRLSSFRTVKAICYESPSLHHGNSTTQTSNPTGPESENAAAAQ